MYFTWSKFILRLMLTVVMLPLLLLSSVVLGYKEYRYVSDMHGQKAFVRAFKKSVKTLASTTGLYILGGLKVFPNL